jgi:hypothetical protein
MNRSGVIIALWLAFAFVAWNVVYDRQVRRAAVEFAREQVSIHQQGGTPASLHAGFSPRVREAALYASLWVSPILVAGALALYFMSWRKT